MAYSIDDAFQRLDEQWILPTKGTLGNKSKNLLENKDAIRSAGLERPEAVVIPPEYLLDTRHPAAFTLEVIDRLLPAWTSVYVRSNAPTEDNGRRMPGMYKTERISHQDRSGALTNINAVLDSYDTFAARLFRRNFGITESGMGLLIERGVSDGVPDLAGTFTDIGTSSVLVLVNPAERQNAMTEQSLSKFIVRTGKISPQANAAIAAVAMQLHGLIQKLPLNMESWEVEFVYIGNKLYAEQLTPIRKTPHIEVPDNAQALFTGNEVYGSLDHIVNGLMVLGSFESALKLSDFDDRHQGKYAILGSSELINRTYSMRRGVLLQLMKSRAFAFVPHDECGPLAAHVQQFLRNSGTAFYVSCNPPSSNNLYYPTPRLPKELSKALATGDGSYYTPTKMRIIADEQSQEAVVIPLEPLKPLQRII